MQETAYRPIKEVRGFALDMPGESQFVGNVGASFKTLRKMKNEKIDTEQNNIDNIHIHS